VISTKTKKKTLFLSS